jgi:hypothetical protein
LSTQSSSQSRHPWLTDLAAQLIFPCLAIGTTLIQQRETWTQGVGQVLLWISILAALELVYSHPRLALMGLTALAIIVFSRALRLVTAGPIIDSTYTAGLALLYGTAGAVVVWTKPKMLNRQFAALLFLSAPLMVVQLTGGPDWDWVHMWRTDSHNASGYELFVPILGQTNPQSGWGTFQLRPAGIIYANNFLSIVVLFGMALHLARMEGRRLAHSDRFLAAVLTLAMAKLLFLAYLVFLSGYLIFGSADRRWRMLKLTSLLTLFLALYWWLFPGAFIYNLSPTSILLNFTIRWADLLGSLTGGGVISLIAENLNGVSTYTILTGSESGYAKIGRRLPWLAAMALVMLPVYVGRLRTIWRHDPQLGRIVINIAVAACLAPLITWFLTGPFFLCAAGAAFLPLAALHVRNEVLAKVGDT